MFQRFGVYVVPDGVWGDFGASWLGWDIRTGSSVPSIEPRLRSFTERPRKYGFHGTIKAPFRLAYGHTQAGLVKATQALARDFEAFDLTSLHMSQIGSFFALVAPLEHNRLRAVADRTVIELDGFRAPLTEVDLQRRRKSRLTEQQDANLETWGYPYIFDDFKFHLTLTGSAKRQSHLKTALDTALAGPLTEPLLVQDVCVCGEDEDGRFHLIERCAFGS